MFEFFLSFKRCATFTLCMSVSECALGAACMWESEANSFLYLVTKTELSCYPTSHNPAFPHRVSFSPGWLQTVCIAVDDLELLIFLGLLPQR